MTKKRQPEQKAEILESLSDSNNNLKKQQKIPTLGRCEEVWN